MTPLERHLRGKPAAPPAALLGLVGHYRGAGATTDVSEHAGALRVRTDRHPPDRLIGRGPAFATQGGRTFVFESEADPPVVSVDGEPRRRCDPGAELVAAFQAQLAASPSASSAPCVPPAFVRADPGDLVTIASVDPRIRIALAYATSDNFMGRPVYPAAVAGLRRSVAVALSRVEDALAAIGYGLLVYDAYRPWSVTRTFWELVPEASRAFVADPAIGSNHNRGCAVDVTLWDVRAGGPVTMPGRFDEPTGRSAADYDGGTSLERWHRDLLRIAMEAGNFTVHPGEWWHFDHATCATSPVLDVALDQVGAA